MLIPGTILQRGGEKKDKKMGIVKWNQIKQKQRKEIIR